MAGEAGPSLLTGNWDHPEHTDCWEAACSRNEGAGKGQAPDFYLPPACPAPITGSHWPEWESGNMLCWSELPVIQNGEEKGQEMDGRASGQITSSRTGMLKGRRKRQVWRSCKLLSMTGY